MTTSSTYSSSLTLFNKPTSSSEQFLYSTDAFKITELPAVVFFQILSYASYEELAPVRQVNHFFKRNVEKRLNDSFVRLGRELSDFSLQMKRRLPKKESQRKEHPLHRYSEIINQLETRHTLLSMTYKKYIDAQISCFIPGKVLDLCFNVLNMIRNYVKNEVYMQLNAINILRDVRDYSTMASEHFDQYIVPILNKRMQNPSFIRQSLDSGRFLSPLMRSNIISSVYSFAMPNSTDYDSDYVSPTQASLNKFSEQLEVQRKQLEDMQKIVNAQNNAIAHCSTVLSEVVKFIPETKSSSISTMVQQMNNSSASLQEMISPVSTSSSSWRDQKAEWLLNQEHKQLADTPCSSSTSAKHSAYSAAMARYALRNRLISSSVQLTPHNRKRRFIGKKHKTDDDE
ncbi:F-box domain-containing protein [Aphelenchoides bicaudatus]|nr:F-box domain-containing protein [Aphelenchoides bicaudatus]